MKNLRQLVEFVKEREIARENKEVGIHPTSSDPIISKFRFCNIDRENDRTTKSLRKIMRNEDENHPLYFLNYVIARLINNDKYFHYYLPLSMWFYDIEEWAEDFMNIAENLKDHSMFSPAYMVTLPGSYFPWDKSKANAIARLVRNIATKAKEKETMHELMTPEGLFKFLIRFSGLADFLINQFITDLKYTNWFSDSCSESKWSFVKSGPGTKRGLYRVRDNIVLEDKSLAYKNNKDEYKEIAAIQEYLSKVFPGINFKDFNNVTNTLCEFDKYCKYKQAGGFARGRLYRKELRK